MKKAVRGQKSNVVFVGYDQDNAQKFACLRGTYTNNNFRMDCTGSDKQYEFCMNGQDYSRLYIYESPIDAMSHASIKNFETGDKTSLKKDNRLSLAGTYDTAFKNI